MSSASPNQTDAIGFPRRGRAKITAKPMIVRAPGNTARGKRLRDLFSAFLTTMGAPTDVVAQANALAAAELIVAGEEARARLLAGTGNVDEVVRIENLAARAAKRLDVGRKREHKPRSIEELVAS